MATSVSGMYFSMNCNVERPSIPKPRIKIFLSLRKLIIEFIDFLSNYFIKPVRQIVMLIITA